MKTSGFGDEVFKSSEVEESKEVKKSLMEYKSVLNSKNNEEALVCNYIFIYIFHYLFSNNLNIII